jgi:hypothetical protein
VPDVIPDFEAMSIAEIKQWISLNPKDYEGSKQASAVLEIQRTESATGGETRVDEAGEPSLIPPSGNLDFCGAREVFAHVDELLHIFEHEPVSAGSETHAAITALIKQASLHASTADGQEENQVSQLATVAVASLVMVVVRATFSMLAFHDDTTRHGLAYCFDDTKRDKIKVGVQTALAKMSALQEGEIQDDMTSLQSMQRLVDAAFQAIGAFEPLPFERQGEECSAPVAGTSNRDQSDKVFRESVQKMRELLRTFYDAQTKNEEAVSRT